jgi:O-methyltransferase
MTQVRDETAAELYLELMKKCLTRLAFEEPYARIAPPAHPAKARALEAVQRLLARRGLELVRRSPDRSGRAEGRDWPEQAETMIGLERLDNLQLCVTDVLRRDVPGDLIETGVWRGGATIFMRAILAAYGDNSRTVWVADSFQGLPKPSGRYEADRGDDHWRYDELAVPASAVRENFARYGLLDEQVSFLEGLFQDTLADAPIEQLAVARLDGDMYESTIVALEALYPKLSPGGYLIVDDYGAVPGCRQAVEDYRRENGVTEPLVRIDWTGVYWQRHG